MMQLDTLLPCSGWVLYRVYSYMYSFPINICRSFLNINWNQRCMWTWIQLRACDQPTRINSYHALVAHFIEFFLPLPSALLMWVPHLYIEVTAIPLILLPCPSWTLYREMKPSQPDPTTRENFSVTTVTKKTKKKPLKTLIWIRTWKPQRSRILLLVLRTHKPPPNDVFTVYFSLILLLIFTL